MAAAEIIRRMVWGFFRLEWEYIERYGAAPVPVSQIESLEVERSQMYQRKAGSSSTVSPPLSSSFSSSHGLLSEGWSFLPTDEFGEDGDLKLFSNQPHCCLVRFLELCAGLLLEIGSPGKW
jgi:hypothetical protein